MTLHVIAGDDDATQVLKAVPFPYTITTFQFGSGSFFITLMWLLNLHPKPRLSLQQVKVYRSSIFHDSCKN
jgi:solute carrier family 35 protein E1